ncbi:translation initiation factor eIF-2B subunit delta [Xylariaceae sp. FL1019]|nr:translation initiation factor eIF-2B subunit delta [Xylariaceae sp. FL1019]
MSTAPDGAPSDAGPQTATQPAPANPPQPTNGENAAPPATPKLTNAQLKQQAKAEKQARRAQAKQAKDVPQAPASTAAPSGPPASDGKGSKAKGKPDGAQAASIGVPGRASVSKAPAAPVQPKITIPECFSHLSMAKRLPYTHADKDVNPTILALGQQMSTFEIDDSITRLQATLLAFKKVIDAYITPAGNTLARHLTPHVLNPQIEYLSACRPMCFSMGNAIRWLKLQVSKIDPDVAEADAKKQLCANIDTFIQERVTMADIEIISKAAIYVNEGDTILVYGGNRLVERALLHAHSAAGKNFGVIVVDDPFDPKGQALTRTLLAKGIKVSYSGDFSGLRRQLERADWVLFGAEAVFSNGALYGRAGTCDIAIAAHDLGKQIFVLSESINITERVSTDSLTYNEIDPELCTGAAFRLLYDTTPSKYLTTIITDVADVDATSVSFLLRKLEDSN